MIVVEGADNAGKSTLIKALQTIPSLSTWPVQGSEGPPKYPGEMNERVERYLAYPSEVIYDRHPCVSQPIYGMMRSHLDVIRPELVERFYAQKPLFIYCDSGDRGMKGHVFNPETDSAAHLAEVETNFAALVLNYRIWAAKHAFINYRIGDSVSRILTVFKHEI